MKRQLRFMSLSLALFGASSVHAAGPQLDIHKAMDAAPLANASQRIETSVGTVASVDEKRGVPTFLWVAPPEAAGLSSRVMTRPVEEIARDFVSQNMDLYSLSPGSLETMVVREVHDTGTGGLIVMLAQRVDGIDVWRNEMKVLIDRQGDVIAVGGNLHPDAVSTRLGGTKRVFSVVDTQAIANAFVDRTGIRIQPTNLLFTGREENGTRYFDLTPTAETHKQGIVFATAARVKKVLYAMPERLVPAYYLEVDTSKDGSTNSDLWGYVVSAETGELLERDHLQQDATYSYKVYSDTTAPFTPLDGPIADWTPHPTGVPNGSSPPFITPVTITLDGLNTNPGGTFDPWLAAGATTTTGNNVDAYADIVAGDGFNAGDRRPTATGTNFNFTYDTASAPNTNAQRDASVTSLFFLNNWLHDYYYDSGFNEAAGNAQANNFGRGGSQNDRLLAEAQDYSGTDNANMQTPADGMGSPRMQMYVFTGAIKGNLTVNLPLPVTTLGNQAAAFGPNPFTTTADLILATDGVGPDVNDICENVSNNITGKIALINRGTCTFESKVLRAQQAGAVGVLIMNNAPDTLPGMGDDAATNGVTIGSLGIYQTDGNWLKTLMQSQTVNITMSTSPQKVNRDGTIDNHIVSHEWGHYLHHRLVTTCNTLTCIAGGNAFGCGQCAGESEGWGDFVALHMMLRSGDDLAKTYAASIYASDAFGDAAYFGIRRFPYSRDFTKNALTFKHITDGQTLPTGMPQNAAFANLNEVHNTGEVWAMMLFQAYTELQLNGGHTFAESKRRMANYIVGGMKLSPNNPTFTQQRDGILATARAADLNDARLLADGFAVRGAGTCAVSPAANSTTHAGVVEDFDNVGVMQITGAVVTENPGCDNDGVVDTGETGNVNVSVFNSGIGYLLNTQVTVTSGTAAVTFPSGTMATIASIAPGATGTASIPVALVAGTTAITDADFAITATNATACVTTVNATATAQMNFDSVLASSATEEFENPTTAWTEWGNVGYETLATTLWSRKRQVLNDYWYNGADYSNVSDTALESPNMTVGAGNLTISFQHAFDFDYSTGPVRYWDGGVVEVTKDNGMTWADVATLGAAPGYTGALQAGSGNPLAGRQAYSRRNAAWPATNAVSLNLGTQFAGQTIKVRFRIATDNAVHTAGTQGWFIDTVVVNGITNTPFNTITLDPLGCSLCAGVTCNDNNSCTTDACNPANGQCVFTNAVNGTACNDGNACTTGESCNAGTCSGGATVSCTDGNTCTTDSCNPASGCVFTNVTNGTACNDSNACTQTDTCQAGTCTGANPVTCTASDQCHDVGTCNTMTGVCSNPAKANGSACSDGSACTTGETCNAGTCGGGTAVTCNDSNTCTTDSCNPASGCVFTNVANGTACSDSNACTQMDTCQAGTCTGANPVTCAASDACHDIGTCNPATGMCSNPAKPNGATCSDGSACTTGETCNAGTCGGGTAVMCNDSNTCTTDSCNPASGCVFTNVSNGTACSDGNACTQSDTCQAGTCTGANPITCSASDACHVAGVCNPATGACSNPNAADGTACNDSDACTQSDTCQAGTCTGANPITCSASDACHVAGVCNPATGACSNPNAADGTACNDSDACTQSDTCQAGTCTGASPITCSASDQCHVVGMCDPMTGVCSNPTANDGSNCNDNDACTVMDSCKGGTCSGTPIVCDMPTECQNAGSCNPMNGMCMYPAKPDGTACTNGTCQSGMCMTGTGGAGGTAGMGGAGGTAGMGGAGGTAGTGGVAGMGGAGGKGGSAGMGGSAGAGGGTGGKAGAGGAGGMGGEGGRGGSGGSGGKPIPEGGGCDCASTTSNTSPTGSALLLGLGALIAGLRRRRNDAA